MRISYLAWIAAAALVAGAANATEETGTSPTQPPEAAAPDATATGAVERATLTSGILDREPQDELDEVASDRGKVFYFTELRDMPGETVLHRWEHRGEVVSEVRFEIGSARWRTWSSKDVDPERLGQWSVSAVGSDGRVLDTRVFTVVEAGSAAAVPAAPTP